MKYEMDLKGVDGLLELLKKLPPELLGARGGPVRAALRKGAQVIQKQAVANLDVVTSNETSKGRRLSIGLLRKAVVVSRGKASGRNERYLVRVVKKVYPARGPGAETNTQLNAARLEYGTSMQPAEPWLRPAFNAKAVEAIQTVESELVKGVAAAVAKLSGGA